MSSTAKDIVASGGVSPGIPLLTDLFGALTGASADRMYTEKINKQQMDFASAQAGLQRDWQERMDNSKYQRGMTDMKKAGLNPLVMMSGGGAPVGSTPSGASASANLKKSDYGKILQQGISQSVATANQARLVKQQVDAMKHNIKIAKKNDSVVGEPIQTTATKNTNYIKDKVKKALTKDVPSAIFKNQGDMKNLSLQKVRVIEKMQRAMKNLDPQSQKYKYYLKRINFLKSQKKY